MILFPRVSRSSISESKSTFMGRVNSSFTSNCASYLPSNFGTKLLRNEGFTNICAEGLNNWEPLLLLNIDEISLPIYCAWTLVTPTIVTTKQKSKWFNFPIQNKGTSE